MKKILLVLVMVFSTSAFAAPGAAKTTDMFAPKAGGSEFLVGLLLRTGKVAVAPDTATLSGMELALQYGYGFSDSAAFYVNQGYSNTEMSIEVSGVPGSTKNKTTGIGDTKIGVKAVIDFKEIFFYYDIGYQMALLAKAKTDSSGDKTAVSERPMLQAQGGVGADLSDFGLGASFAVVWNCVYKTTFSVESFS